MVDRQRKQYKVPSVDIMSVLNSIDESKGDIEIFLKVDIEGAEFALLRHLLKHPSVFRNVQYVIIEWHERYMPREKGQQHVIERQLLDLGVRILIKPEFESGQNNEPGSFSKKTTIRELDRSPKTLSRKRKCAVVIYISTIEYLQCMKVAAFSLQSTTADVILATTTDLSINGSEPSMVHWKSIPNPNGHRGHFKHNYNVLHMWNMTDYDQVIALDADMLVTKPLDDLCGVSLPDGYIAAADTWWTSQKDWDKKGYFNAGLIALAPSTNVFRALKKASLGYKSYNGGVNSFLNHYFRGKVIKLDPLKWGMNANAYKLRQETWDDKKIHAIHYTTKAKPCHTSPESFRMKPDNHPYVQWHRMSRRMQLSWKF
jgi:hypothetical protein